MAVTLRLPAVVPPLTKLLYVFQSHFDECQKLPMPCPNKCEKTIVISRDEVRKA